MAGSTPAQQLPPDDLVEVGRVAAAHGVRGWLKIRPHSTDAGALLGTRTWWLGKPLPDSIELDCLRPAAVRACRRQGGQFLAAQIDGVTDRDAAEALRGYGIWVSRSDFPKARDDEYYWVDLIGCDFYGRAGADAVLLGRVDEIFDNGAHAVLQIAVGVMDDSGAFQGQVDARGRPRHILVPFVAQHILGVDLAQRRIDSDWTDDF